MVVNWGELERVVVGSMMIMGSGVLGTMLGYSIGRSVFGKDKVGSHVISVRFVMMVVAVVLVYFVALRLHRAGFWF